MKRRREPPRDRANGPRSVDAARSVLKAREDAVGATSRVRPRAVRARLEPEVHERRTDPPAPPTAEPSSERTPSGHVRLHAPVREEIGADLSRDPRHED